MHWKLTVPANGGVVDVAKKARAIVEAPHAGRKTWSLVQLVSVAEAPGAERCEKETSARS